MDAVLPVGGGFLEAEVVVVAVLLLAVVVILDGDGTRPTKVVFLRFLSWECCWWRKLLLYVEFHHHR